MADDEDQAEPEPLEIQVKNLRAKIRYVQRQRDEWQKEALLSRKCLKELKTQIMGGTHLPEDPTHAGNVLIAMGWEYAGPPTEGELDQELEDHSDTSVVYCWLDPERKGTGTIEACTLTDALNRAFRRFIQRQNEPTWLQRLTLDDDEE